MKQLSQRRKQRRFWSALTAAALSLASLPMQVTAYDEERENGTGYGTDQIVPGDVNGDGEVSVIDLIVLQGYLHGHDNVEIYAPWNADTNGDDVVDIFDLAFAKRILLAGGHTAIPVTPGDDDPEPTETPTVTEGKLYRRAGLIDQYAGIVAFQTLLPDGWNAAMASDWTFMSLNYPGVEYVRLTSPDGKAGVNIQSNRDYRQDLMNGKTGQDFENYITYESYMNADTFVQYAVESSLGSATLVKEFDDNAEELAMWQKLVAENAEKSTQEAAFYGYQMNIEGMESSICRRQYQAGDALAEVSAVTNAFQYSIYYQIDVPFSQQIVWDIPYVVTYYAEDQAAFDAYYSDYEVILSNSCFTRDFYAMCEYSGKRLLNIMLSAKTQSQNEWMGSISSDYSTDGYSSDTSVSKQDVIFQAWDDYIKDENAYSLNDGSTLRVPTSIDTVAQNGDSVYFGTPGGVPSGFDILTAN